VGTSSWSNADWPFYPQVVRRILETGPVDVFINNHFAGYAVASIEHFESLRKASS
jgi:hypothetical protein